MTVRLIQGDALEQLRLLPSDSVHVALAQCLIGIYARISPMIILTGRSK